LLSRQEAGPGAGQEQDHIGHLFACARPSQGVWKAGKLYKEKSWNNFYNQMDLIAIFGRLPLSEVRTNWANTGGNWKGDKYELANECPFYLILDWVHPNRRLITIGQCCIPSPSTQGCKIKKKIIRLFGCKIRKPVYLLYKWHATGRIHIFCRQERWHSMPQWSPGLGPNIWPPMKTDGPNCSGTEI
jgi:hypothetical protein